MLPTRKQLHHHVYHHGRFYVALVSGLLVFAAAVLLHGPQPIAAAGDAFFLVYLVEVLGFLFGHTPADLRRRAARQDEGILVVVAITLGIIAVNLADVFQSLNASGKPDTVSLVLVSAAAPLGWFVLHALSALHYASMFYFDPPGEAKSGEALEFPGTQTPDLWDFLYFSFVIGMTAQVSDVQVRSGAMRKATLGHGIVSFFFNTVLIALVVNVVVAR